MDEATARKMIFHAAKSVNNTTRARALAAAADRDELMTISRGDMLDIARCLIVAKQFIFAVKYVRQVFHTDLLTAKSICDVIRDECDPVIGHIS